MYKEFEAPRDWSVWTGSGFQRLMILISVTAISYHMALQVHDYIRSLVVIIVTVLLLYLVTLSTIDKYRNKLHGTDPSPDTAHVTKWLPYRPYEDAHEKITDPELAQYVDIHWDKLLKSLLGS